MACNKLPVFSIELVYSSTTKITFTQYDPLQSLVGIIPTFQQG